MGLLAVSAFGADAGLGTLLKNVESRYNKAKTLEVAFNEVYTPPGRPRRSESGTLRLRKPGRMRWDYSKPAGKLFVSDGKYLWLYTPDEKRVERMMLKETGDMRAPLAFLLGKLNFAKEFRNLKAAQEGTLTRITAEPVSESLPYSAVEFLVTADSSIREVKVTGFDKSILLFTFDQERVDVPFNPKLFEYQPPPGVELVVAEEERR
jgi:outer membrane lipoprotein carrier protein